MQTSLKTQKVVVKEAYMTPLLASPRMATKLLFPLEEIHHANQALVIWKHIWMILL
jgi:hypothetical protein